MKLDDKTQKLVDRYHELQAQLQPIYKLIQPLEGECRDLQPLIWAIENYEKRLVEAENYLHDTIQKYHATDSPAAKTSAANPAVEK